MKNEKMESFLCKFFWAKGLMRGENLEEKMMDGKQWIRDIHLYNLLDVVVLAQALVVMARNGGGLPLSLCLSHWFR